MRRLRLFVAVELPAQWRQWLGDLSARLRPQLPPARWVRPEQMHLTLAFFAAVDEERVAKVEEAVASSCSESAPMPLKLGAAGTFPPAGRARVAWVAVSAGPDLGALAARVRERAGAAAAVPLETRPFRPHLTVARCRPPWRRGAVEKFVNAVSADLVDSFTAREVSLIESTLGTTGARYRTLASLPLETPA